MGFSYWPDTSDCVAAINAMPWTAWSAAMQSPMLDSLRVKSPRTWLRASAWTHWIITQGCGETGVNGHPETTKVSEERSTKSPAALVRVLEVTAVTVPPWMHRITLDAVSKAGIGL